MAERNLTININANNSDFKKRLNEAKLETEKLQKNLSKFSKQSAIAFTAISASITGTVLAFRGFQRDFTQVITLLDKSSFTTKTLEKGIKDLEKGILDLRASSGESFETLNKGLFDLISAGIPAEEAINNLAVATELAAAGGTDVAIAVDAITTSINAFGLEASKAEEVAQKFFLAQKNGKTTVAEIAGSLGVAASSASSFGVSLDEVLAATSAVTLAGKSTSQSLTGLNQVFANIAKPTKEAVEEAQRLGIEFNTTALRSKGLAGFLNELVTAEGFATSSIEKLFGSVEAMGVAFALTGKQNNDFVNTLSQLQNQAQLTETFNNALAESNATVDRALNKLGGSIQAVFVTLGAKFAPLIIKVSDILVSFAQKIQGASDRTLSIIKNVTIFIATVTGLATVLGTAGLAFIALRNGIKATGVQLLFTNKIVLGFVGSIGKAIVSTKAFAVSLITTSNAARVFWAALGGPIGKIVTGLGAVAAAALSVRKAFGAEGTDEVSNVLETRKKRIIQLQEEQAKLADQVLSNDQKVSESAAERLLQIDNEISKLQELNKVMAKKPAQEGGGGVETPQPTVEDDSLEQEKVNSQKRIDVKVRETELKIQQARREAEVLKAIREEATEEEITSLREKNELLAEEERLKLENELLNAELKTEELTAEREAQIEKQLELNEVELENVLAHKELLGEVAEEDRQKEQEAKDLIRNIERDQQVKFNEEEIKLLKDQLKGKKQITDKFLLEKINKQQQTDQRFLKMQREFGTKFAKADKALNSEKLKGVRQTTGQLAALKNSENSKLKAIGKAAAIANIAIDTAKGAMAAYAALAGIPFVGPALGIAAAAALIAFGVEQTAAATKANTGAFVSRGITGVDNQPFLLSKGESVIPADITPELFNTFKQLREIKENGGLINTLARQSILQPALQTTTIVNEENIENVGQTIEDAQDEAEPQPISIDINIDDDVADFITAQQRENESLGIGVV
jgi:TP901 family phage tail tape measure protein